MLLYEVTCVSTGEVQEIYMECRFNLHDKMLLDFGDGPMVWEVTIKVYR